MQMCLLSLSCPYMSSKLEETEINLEEALQNISASKGQDKEKKDLLFSWRVSTELHVPLVSRHQWWLDAFGSQFLPVWMTCLEFFHFYL